MLSIHRSLDWVDGNIEKQIAYSMPYREMRAVLTRQMVDLLPRKSTASIQTYFVSNQEPRYLLLCLKLTFAPDHPKYVFSGIRNQFHHQYKYKDLDALSNSHVFIFLYHFKKFPISLIVLISYNLDTFFWRIFTSIYNIHTAVFNIYVFYFYLLSALNISLLNSNDDSKSFKSEFYFLFTFIA